MRGRQIEMDTTAISPVTDEELTAVGGAGEIFGGDKVFPIKPGKLGYLSAAFTAGFAIGTYLDSQFDISEWLGDELYDLLKAGS